MRGKVSPVSFVVLIAVFAVGVNVLRDRVAIFGGGAGDNTEGTSECPAGDPSFCDEGILAGPNAARVILQASETCKDVGYLCAELEESDVQRTYRWPDGTARLRIRIPPLQVRIETGFGTSNAQRSVAFSTGVASPSS